MLSASKDGKTVQGKIEKGGGVTYVEAAAFNEGSLYWLYIVEKGAMKQDVAADASAKKAVRVRAPARAAGAAPRKRSSAAAEPTGPRVTCSRAGGKPAANSAPSTRDSRVPARTR